MIILQQDFLQKFITCLRSKDLNDWELCGAVDNGFSCWIDKDEWIQTMTWAPEVLRNPTDGKYYIEDSLGTFLEGYCTPYH